jgi:hypothetical protein
MARMRTRRRTCPICRKRFTPSRADAVTCSGRCRQKAYRLRKNPNRWKASGDECGWNPEREKAFPTDSDRRHRRDAAQYQSVEALRLAEEYALLRPGTIAAEITGARIRETRRVANAWTRLAVELQRRRERD